MPRKVSRIIHIIQILTKMKNCFKLVGMLFLSMFLISFSCNNTSSGKNKQVQKEANSHSYEGMYENSSDKNVKLKLINIQDSIYYFEFFNILKDSSDQKIFGTFIDSSGCLKLLSVSEPLTVINLQSSQTGNFTVDPKSLKIYDAFSNIQGKYVQIGSNNQLSPDFNTFISNKWDEGIAIKSRNVLLYELPYRSKPVGELNLNKGDTVKSYIDTYRSQEPGFDFIYIKTEASNGSFVGWMRADDFYTLVKRVFQCQRDDDGSIEKWNKEDRYTLYLDKSGKTIKKVKD